MRLDATYLTYITKDEMRVLLAIEMGMKNHEFVPIHLVERIAHLGRSSTFSNLNLLVKNKLVYHEAKKFNGYKLTYLGYDYLALNVFMKRGVIKSVVGKIGVGKESDIYKCLNDDGDEVVLKLARLGRVSFKTVKNNRDYIQHRTQFNWLYLSRLQAIKEYTFMEILFKNGFPTPVPHSQNRHGIVMNLINGGPMTQIKGIGNPEKVHNELIDLIIKLAEHGLIHSDFNEFNLMMNQEYKITMIDFPQMVSTKHANADYYFERDIDCIHRYFEKKMKFVSNYTCDFSSIKTLKRLDLEAKASGYLKKELQGKIQDLDILDDILLCSGDEEGEEEGNEEEEQEEENNEQKGEDVDEELHSDIEDLLDNLDNNSNKKEGQNLQQKTQDQKLQDIVDGFSSDEEEEKINQKQQQQNGEEDEEEESDEEEEFDYEKEKERKKQLKQQKKEEKKNKKKQVSTENSLRLKEQLMEKIRKQEEKEQARLQKIENRKLKREQEKLEKKQQQQENNENNNEEEQQQEEEDLTESESEEEDDEEVDQDDEELREKVDKHIKQQISKKFRTKFKTQKLNKADKSAAKDFFIR